MKDYSLLIICLILFTSNVNSQITFQKTIGNTGLDEANSVQQTTDYGYIIAGNRIAISPNRDVLLIRTNEFGDTLWTRSYGGNLLENGTSVQQTNDGGFIIGGSTASFATGGFHTDLYLIKTNSFGDTLWTRTFGSDHIEFGYSVKQTNDNGYILTGYTTDFVTVGQDIYLIKLDSSGDTLWTRTYGGLYSDIGLSVSQTSDEGYIISGSIVSFAGGGRDAILMKTDSLGSITWSKLYWDGYYNEATSSQQTSDGGYILAGQTGYGFGNDADILLIKTNSLGDTIWTKTFGKQSGNDYALSIQQTNDGGYIIAGKTNSFSAGDYNAYVIKTDSSGNSLWSKTFGGVGDENGTSIQQTTDGGYVLVGSTTSFGAGNSDVYLIKLDANGNSNCNEGNPNTITSGVFLNVTDPLTVLTLPNTIVTSPPTQMASGSAFATLCFSVGIQESIHESQLQIAPNPNFGDFTISVPPESKILSVEIFSALGECIYSVFDFIDDNEMQFNIPDKGIYIVKSCSGIRCYTNKVIVE